MNAIAQAYLEATRTSDGTKFLALVQEAIRNGKNEEIMEAISQSPNQFRNDIVFRIDTTSSVLEAKSDGTFPTLFACPMSIHYTGEVSGKLDTDACKQIVNEWKKCGIFPESAVVTLSGVPHLLEAGRAQSHCDVHNVLPNVVISNSKIDGEPEEILPKTEANEMILKTMFLLGIVDETSEDPEENISDDVISAAAQRIAEIAAKSLGLSEGVVSLYDPEPFHAGLYTAIAIQAAFTVSAMLKNIALSNNMDVHGIRAVSSLHDMGAYMQFRVGAVSRLTNEFIGGFEIDAMGRTQDEFLMISDAVTDAILHNAGEAEGIQGVQGEMLTPNGQTLFFIDGGHVQYVGGIAMPIQEISFPRSPGGILL